MPAHRIHRRRALRAALVTAAAIGALAAACVSPAWAAPTSDAAASAASGAPVAASVELGSGVTASVGERDGSLAIAVPIGGLRLTWRSRAVRDDPGGLGRGWGFGFTRIEVAGGVRLLTRSGGVYEMDASQPSGLAGYGVHDLTFAATDETVPARDADGEAARAAYRLRELGGDTSWFDEKGNPIMHQTAEGARTDWSWGRDTGRLDRVTDPDGVVTTLEWSVDGRRLTVRPASNLPPIADHGERVWRVSASEGGRLRVDDPASGRVELLHDDGRPVQVSTASGASTEVQWRIHDDGVPRIARLDVRDAAGARLAGRTWAPGGDALSSGWPAHQQGEHGLFLSSDSDFAYETQLSDGSASQRTAYTSLRLPTSRHVSVSAGSGNRELTSQTFTYPHGAEHPDPNALPGNWSQPIAVETAFHSTTGAHRTAIERAEFDEFGRRVSATAADGTVTTTEYDDGSEPTDVVGVADRRPPVGLATRRVTTAPDGLMVETVDRLNETRTAVVASETRTGRGSGPSTVTERTEYTVEPDGFVSAEHAFPGADSGDPPVVTTRNRVVDLAAGISTVIETRAAGTPAATTTSTTTALAHGGITAEVDAVGNTFTRRYDALGRVVVATDGTTFTYDAADRVTSRATADGTVTVSYWADGTRRSQSITREPDGGVDESVYRWDGALLVNDVHRSADGAAGTASYLIGTGRHARTTHDDATEADAPADGPAETTWYGTDRHGNVTELFDAEGRIVERTAYSDYGVATSERAGTGAGHQIEASGSQVGALEHNPFGFSGEQTDDGWQYLRARVYHPETARFTTEDPEPLIGPYLYADANPVTVVDPTGHRGEDDARLAQVARGASIVAGVLNFLAILVPPAAITPFVVAAYAYNALTFASNVFSIVQNTQLLDSGIFDEDPDRHPLSPAASGAEGHDRTTLTATLTGLSTVFGFWAAVLLRTAKLPAQVAPHTSLMPFLAAPATLIAGAVAGFAISLAHDVAFPLRPHKTPGSARVAAPGSSVEPDAPAPAHGLDSLAPAEAAAPVAHPLADTTAPPGLTPDERARSAEDDLLASATLDRW